MKKNWVLIDLILIHWIKLAFTSYEDEEEQKKFN